MMVRYSRQVSARRGYGRHRQACVGLVRGWSWPAGRGRQMGIIVGTQLRPLAAPTSNRRGSHCLILF